MDVRRVVGWVAIAVLGPVDALFIAYSVMGLGAALATGNAWNVLLSISGVLLYAAIPTALLLIAIRMVRAPRSTSEAPRPRPTPVRALDEPAIDEVELLAQLEGPVSACPECGFLGVRAPGMRDGLWPGGGETGARFVCPRCNYQGIPIEFDNGDDYAAWVRELNATREAPP